jgi:hypothetical protein
LTKEERAAEALRRRAEQVEALRAAQDEEKKRREEFNKEGKQELREMERANRYRKEVLKGLSHELVLGF